MGNSKHHQIYGSGPSWTMFDENFDGADLGSPPPPSSCDAGTCDGGGWMDEWCNCQYSPILVSIGSNKYRFTKPSNGVAFDINADGTLDQTSWTRPDSDDAFLVLDRNGNGNIDNGRELFGTATMKSNGQLAANGFEALQDLDGGLLSDGKIDQHDAVYGQLRMWFDTNHNGWSEPAELVGLAAAGVDSLYVGYEQSQRVDQHGNSFKFKGWAFVRPQPWSTPERRRIFDVFFSIVR